MVRYLQQLSATLFYALGASFFLAYLFFRNEIASPWMVWWFQIADLPMIIVALLYGGTSLYQSIEIQKMKKTVAVCIAIPLFALFALLVVLNFWPQF